MKGDDGLGARPVAGWDGLAVSRGCLRAVADQERVHRVQVERPDRLVGEHLRRGARPPKSGTRPVEMGDMSSGDGGHVHHRKKDAAMEDTVL